MRAAWGIRGGDGDAGGRSGVGGELGRGGVGSRTAVRVGKPLVSQLTGFALSNVEMTNSSAGQPICYFHVWHCSWLSRIL